MASKLEVVHVVMESRAQQERAKPPSYQTSSSCKVPTNKTGLSRPTMHLFSRTSPGLAHASPSLRRPLSLPGRMPAGISFTSCSTRPSLTAGALLNNGRGASSRNPGLPRLFCGTQTSWYLKLQYALSPCICPFCPGCLSSI